MFLNYIKGIDPSMASNMDLVENDVNNYTLKDLTNETIQSADILLEAETPEADQTCEA